MGKETQWHLFLDESGSFARGRTVCLGGLLIQSDDGSQLTRVLKHRLEKAWPAVRYPPHATELRRPAAHLGEWMAATRQEQARHPEARVLADLSRKVVEAADRPEAFLALVEDWRAGRKPPGGTLHEILRDAEGFLRALDPTGLELLNDIRDRGVVAMRDIFSDLEEMAGRDRCFVVAAVDRREAGEEGEGRYLDLLEVLFERIFALLRDRSSEQQKVWVIAENHRIPEPNLGVMIDLRAQDIGAVVRKAERFPWLRPTHLPDPTVRVVPTQPQGKDENTHPGLVLADHLMNTLFSAGIKGRGEFEALAANVEARTGIRPDVTPRALSMVLPAIAVQGDPRQALLEHLSGGQAVSMDESAPRWARQQAEAWMAALGGGG